MRKLKILIIDNDEDEQYFIKKGFLSTELYEIIAVFSNGADFINRIYQLQDKPDVVLSDLNMPGKNGLEILQEIKSDPLLLHLPVIITSNVTTPELIARCAHLGAFALKSKPDDFLNYEQFATDLYHEINAKN
jgi:CheY-like chemotaxis protein